MDELEQTKESNSCEPETEKHKYKLVAAVKLGSSYSGYAYSFNEDFTQNPLKIGTFPWNSSNRYTTLKTPSAVLCNPDGKFDSFGYHAEERHQTLGPEAEKWYYFTTLPTIKKLTDTTTLTDVTGKTMLASKIFEMALRYFREHLLVRLQTRLYSVTPADIKWMIVSQQKDNEDFLKIASAVAGMMQNVNVITKMDAALTYLQCSSIYRGKSFTPGKKIYVLDATETAVEVTTCENENGQIEPKDHKYFIGLGGSTVNLAIKNLIEAILGVDDIAALDDINFMMKEIEDKKRKLKPGSRQSLVIRLPERFKDAKPVNRRIPGKVIPGVLDDADFDGKIKFVHGKAHIEYEVIEGILITCARNLVGRMKECVSSSELNAVGSIIMIGGYSESEFLHNAVRQGFPDLKVYTVFESGIADLKGAVIFGHSNGQINTDEHTRISQEKVMHYLKTLQDRKNKARNIRVIIVGQEGVGKTTLCKRMLNETDAVIKEIKSTDGVDIYIQRFLVNMMTKNRKKLESNTEVQNAKEKIQNFLLLHKMTDSTLELNDRVQNDQPEDQVIQNQDSTLFKDENLETENSPSEKPNVDSGPQQSSSASCDHFSNGSMTNRDRQEQWSGDMTEILQRADSNELPEENQAYLSLWDFGGEETYYNTHHIFLSSDAIYLVVYNLRECIEESDEVTSSALRRLRYWIHSAVNYWENDDRNKTIATPPVILVGTHLDQLSGTEKEVEQKLDLFEKKLCGKTEIQTMKDHIYGFIEVDNNVQNHPGISHLWDAILEVAPSQSQWEKDLPARWLTLEREIMKKKEEGEKVIKFEDVVSLERTCEVKFSDDTEIHMFLKYLHYTGSILYFGEEREHVCDILAKTIILDPQWIANAFRRIITVQKAITRQERRLRFLWNIYQSSAVLEMEYLRMVWKRDEKEAFWEYKDTVLAFMERLGLIARPRQNKCSIENDMSNVYLVPSMLSGDFHGLPRQLTDRYAVKSRTLCFVFETKGVPSPILDKFLAACIEKYEVLKTGDETWLRRGIGIFRVDSVWSVLICCRGQIVKVTLYKQSPYPKIEAGAGLRVRLFVEETLKKIMELYGHGKIQFSYHLHCKPTEIEGGVTISKTELESRRTVSCCTDSTSGKHFIHKHELEPWFSDARPPLTDELDQDYDLPSEVLERCPTDRELLRFSKLFGAEYFTFFIILGLKSEEISQVNLQYSAENIAIRFFHLLCKWQKAKGAEASIRRIMDAMKESEMDICEVVRRGVFDRSA